MLLRTRHSRLARAARFALPLLLAAGLSSCAYMQTHKNIRERGRSYQGYKLDKPRQLYRSNGTWYVAATPAEYGLRHDVVHDNVFRKTNEPMMVLQKLTQEQPAYHAISSSTATVLLRADGYADNATLAREITESPSPWLSSLPHASVHHVNALVDGEDSLGITYEPRPAQVPLSYHLLSGIDFLAVDIPGTVVYNVAVPFLAPFVFFYEFLSE